MNYEFERRIHAERDTDLIEFVSKAYPYGSTELSLLAFNLVRILGQDLQNLEHRKFVNRCFHAVLRHSKESDTSLKPIRNMADLLTFSEKDMIVNIEGVGKGSARFLHSKLQPLRDFVNGYTGLVY
jgi:hypothetical protein